MIESPEKKMKFGGMLGINQNSKKRFINNDQQTLEVIDEEFFQHFIDLDNDVIFHQYTERELHEIAEKLYQPQENQEFDELNDESLEKSMDMSLSSDDYVTKPAANNDDKHNNTPYTSTTGHNGNGYTFHK